MADAAAGAEVVVVAVTLAFAEFGDGFFGTGGVAVVALEAVAAGEAAAGFVDGLVFG